MSEQTTYVTGKRPTDCRHSEGTCKDCQFYPNCELEDKEADNG